MALLVVAVAAVWSMQLGASAQGRRSNWPDVDGRGSTEIFASNKKTDTNRSEQRLGYIRARACRLPFPFLKPALALMYPNRCFFAAVSVRLFIGGEYFMSAEQSLHAQAV